MLYDNLNLSPKRFGLSLMPHLLELSSPVTPDGKTALEIGVPIGKMLSSVKITRVIQEWGVMCRTDDGLEGFVHVSTGTWLPQASLMCRLATSPTSEFQPCLAQRDRSELTRCTALV